MNSNTIKYFNFNVTFKVSKDDTFSEVITFTPKVDNQIKLFLFEEKSENEFSFPDDQDLPNIKKFNRLLHYNFNEASIESDRPYLSLEYNGMFVNEYEYNGSDFYFYNGSDIAGKIELYDKTETQQYNVTDVFYTEQTSESNNKYCKIWLKEYLWNEDAEDERFNKKYNFVIYFKDSKNDLLAEKDVRIPSIYRPFYMQNYIILISKNDISNIYDRYMFNINNAVGLKDKNGHYIIGDVETSIQVNYEDNDKDKEYKKDFKYQNLQPSNISSLLFKNYSLSRNGKIGEGTKSNKTITLKYKIQFKEKEPTFSHPDFLINSVYEENNLSFYGISYSVELDKNKKCAKIYIKQVKGTSSSGIRYFVTNMEFAKFVDNVYNIKVPLEKYDLYPSKIREKESWYDYYCGVYSFDKIFKTAPDDTSIVSQNSSKKYAYELKNLYEYNEGSSDGYYILTYKFEAPENKSDEDIKKDFHIVAIYDPVTLLSDDDMIQEQLYSKILKPHNNFTSIMRIY